MELLENFLRQPLRDTVLALVEDIPENQKLERAAGYYKRLLANYEVVLTNLLEKGGQGMRSLVAYHVGELRLHRLQPVLEGLPYDFTGPVGRSVRRALAMLSAPQVEDASHG